jgi:WD40 repeat protein
LWDVQTGKQVQIFEHPDGDEIYAVAYSPDGKQVLTGGFDHLVRLWDIETGMELHEFSGHTDPIISVAFSPDGKNALSGSADGTARLWDVTTGVELRRFGGHTSGVEVAAFSPDGKYVLTGSDDGAARLWFADYHDEIRYLCSRLPRDFTDVERKLFDIRDTTPTCPKP